MSDDGGDGSGSVDLRSSEVRDDSHGSHGSHGSKPSVPFRSWFYFRTGYSEYFMFIFGAANTLTLTYYLALDNYPALQSVFSSFTLYVALVTLTGFPIMILVGYLHMRRTSAFRSQVEISVESNPYMYKLPPGVHQEVLAPLFYEVLGALKKADAGEKLTPDEVKAMRNLDEKLGFLAGGGILKRPENFGGL